MPLRDMVPSSTYMGATMEEQQDAVRMMTYPTRRHPDLTNSPTTSPHMCQDLDILDYLQLPESACFFFWPLGFSLCYYSVFLAALPSPSHK